MKKLIHNRDLGIPYTNRINKTIINLAKSTLGIDKINLLYSKISDHEGVEFANAALKELNISVNIANDGLKNIPEKGAFIAVANFPHGALDGLLMTKLIVGKRSDTKIFGSFLLGQIEPLKDLIISVNPFNGHPLRNAPAIRAAMNHLAQGHGLIIFPAGEVAANYTAAGSSEDYVWSDSAIKFIRSARVPVIPIHISGRNSRKFELYGRIHPVFRTVRLPTELLAKRDSSVEVAIASALDAKMIGAFDSVQKVADFLRANIFLLSKAFADQPAAPSVSPFSMNMTTEILAEIENLTSDCSLLESGDLVVYSAKVAQIPRLSAEIDLLNMNLNGMIPESPADLKASDNYYLHLFVWDKIRRRVLCGTRYAYGDSLFDALGFEGLYSHSFFEYSPKFIPIVKQSLVISRTFEVAERDNSAMNLLLLFQALKGIVDKNPQYQYLLGTLSVSHNLSEHAANLIVQYAKLHCADARYVKLVLPRSAASGGIKSKRSTQYLSQITDVNQLEKIVADLNQTTEPISTLLRSALNYSTVLATCKDAKEPHSIGALVIVDVNNLNQR